MKISKISVVAPIYNESGNIRPFVGSLNDVLKALACSYEIITGDLEQGISAPDASCDHCIAINTLEHIYRAKEFVTG